MRQPATHDGRGGHPLERFALLRGLPRSLLDLVATHGVECRLEEGDVLFFKDDPGDFLALVVDGLVYGMLYGADGQELIIGATPPCGVVDAAVLLDRPRRSFTAVACADAVVLKLGRRHFPELVAVPGVLERVHAALCDELRQAIENLETLCLHRLETRLARCLLLRLPATLRGNTAEVVLPPTQSLLAAMVNASRSKLNVQLQHWQRSGLVTRHRNLLRIHDLDALRGKACLRSRSAMPVPPALQEPAWRPAA